MHDGSDPPTASRGPSDARTSRPSRPGRGVEEPGERRRRVLRWVYFPYTWLVFIPFLAVTTIVMGCLAMVVARFAPRVAFHFGTVWAWVLCRVNPTWVTVDGREHAARGRSYIILSNHQSHFDILAFYGHWGRQFRWVIKEELRRVPGLGWYCAAGGHIFIDRSSRERSIESLRRARPLLDGGISVMFFPEGTRSRDGRLREFKKGGFMMALDLGLPILPVSISGSRHVLPGRTLQLLPGRIRIAIHEPIDVARYGPERRDELMSDVRKAIAAGLTPWERGEDPTP
ncbi:MAG: 1-acyl-sn-glycerol-3-phosphate acyltransferase [Deltaproteobacteria bacterium]|nr:1-acyl-sn-glycerol-3-phosphate acyltransferase [Deltaproteobacteria bacterium]